MEISLSQVARVSLTGTDIVVTILRGYHPTAVDIAGLFKGIPEVAALVIASGSGADPLGTNPKTALQGGVDGLPLLPPRPYINTLAGSLWFSDGTQWNFIFERPPIGPPPGSE